MALPPPLPTTKRTTSALGSARLPSFIHLAAPLLLVLFFFFLILLSPSTSAEITQLRPSPASYACHSSDSLCSIQPQEDDKRSPLLKRDLRWLKEAQRTTSILQASLSWLTQNKELPPLDARYFRQQLGMKGIKHLVEALDVLLLAYRWPESVLRAASFADMLSNKNDINDREHNAEEEMKKDRVVAKLLKEAEAVSMEALVKAKEVLQQTTEESFHNMVDPNHPTRFQEDSISYLRCYWLALQFWPSIHRHLSSSSSPSSPSPSPSSPSPIPYEAREKEEAEQHPTECELFKIYLEEKGILSAIIDHLPNRGIDQRMGISGTMRWLNYHNLVPSMHSLQQVFERESIISQRRNVMWFLQPSAGGANMKRAYDFTHEIFALVDRGVQGPLPASFNASSLQEMNAEKKRMMTEEDVKYAETALRALLVHCVTKMEDVASLDIAAELYTNWAELRNEYYDVLLLDGGRRKEGMSESELLLLESGKKLYTNVRRWIWKQQKKDGSFGRYEAMEEQNRKLKNNPKWDVRIGGTLHTTYVCLWALVESIFSL